MRLLPLLPGLALVTACGTAPATQMTPVDAQRFTTARKQLAERGPPTSPSPAYKPVEATPKYEYYWPQPPEFGNRRYRYFKIEDQFGCRWWMEAEGKYSTAYIVLNASGKPDCPKQQDWPEKSWRRL